MVSNLCRASVGFLLGLLLFVALNAIVAHLRLKLRTARAHSARPGAVVRKTRWPALRADLLAAPAPCPRGRVLRHLNVLDTKLVGASETAPSRRDPGETHAQAVQRHHASQGDAAPARATEPSRGSRRHGHRRHLCSQSMPGELHEHVLPIGVPDLLLSLLLGSAPAPPRLPLAASV